MKAKLPHPFKVFATQFTLESIVMAICYWSKEIANSPEPSNNYGFSGEKKYSIFINKKKFDNRVRLIQTWLIDMLYHIICMDSFGEKNIQKNESLHLIYLYNDFVGTIDAKYLKYKKDIIFHWKFV